MSNKKKMQGGITLISLVITIIVLLILATVAISIAIDSDGLFARARKAAEDWNTSVSDEEKAMENVFEILNEVNIEGTVGGGEMQPPTVKVQSITLEPTSLSLTEGETVEITATIEPPNATNQNIEWSSESDTTATVSKIGEGKTATVTAERAGTTNIVATVDGQTATCNVEVKTAVVANKPQVPEGANFKYVTWEDTNGDGTYEEILSDTEPKNWYDYGAKQWANIKTTSKNGTNEAYWVWIPRYAYQVPAKPTQSNYTGNPPEFKIVFLQENTNTPINAEDLNGETIQKASVLGNYDSSKVGKWIIHPAFTFGTQELSGIWVAKFEASSSNPSAGSGGGNVTNLQVNVKPNVTEWRNITVSNIFTVCKAMNSTNGALEGASSTRPHMMKNEDWGAVVYLAQSKYGKNGQVWINPNSNLTGQAGTGPDDPATLSTDNYDTGNGPEASTTGNVYGVYDMSGGRREYVAAYCATSVNENYLEAYSDKLINAATGYATYYSRGREGLSNNNYEENKNKYGDALYETSCLYGAWQEDKDMYPYDNYPNFVRGGFYSDKEEAGLFSFSTARGSADSAISFRPVFHMN